MPNRLLNAVCLATLCSFSPLGASEPPPNFVVILCDNLGYGDVGCFGSPRHRTPHVDRLAAEGVRLTHCYSASGVCTPSRAALMTGCYPRRVNLHKNDRGGLVLQPVEPIGLHPDEMTIAEVLKLRGYSTCLIGKWHLGDQPPFLPTRQGFDEYLGIPYSDDMTPRDGQTWPPLPLMRGERVIEAPVDRNLLTKRYTEEAIAYLTRNKDRPFFLLLSHAMPGSTPAPFASEAFRGRSANGPWGDSVEEIDWSTGELMAALKRLDLDQRTLVIWTSDNGAPRRDPPQGSNLPLGGWGYTTAEGGMRMPCIARWPGRIPAGTSCLELVTLMDLLPTFAVLAKAPLPDRTIDGRDISRLLLSEPEAKSPHEAFYYYYQDQLQAVRAGPWKLYLPLEMRLGPGQRRQGPQALAVYNVVNDPAEAVDLHRQQPETIVRLTALAEKARQELGDLGREGAGQRRPGRVERPQPQVLSLASAEDAALPVAAQATMRRWCFDCHGKDLAEGRVNLEQMTAGLDFGRGFKDWEKAASMLRQGKMPPQGSTQPSAAERTVVIAAIEEGLKAYIARHEGDPGPVVLRRLTSAELGYTIEDLTGVDLKLARRFVSDAVGGEGFTNVGGAQFVQDSTLEQYLETAKAVADHAVIGAGPLTFFEHPGQTGRELSAITRIKDIYARTGFRTAAGEGAKPFGLDQYPRAMLVAWRYRHRAARGLGDATLAQLARKEQLSVRLCQHVWAVLSGPSQSFPLSVIVDGWQALPEPNGDEPSEEEIRTACDHLAGELRGWQSVLAAAAGDEEEAAVLTEGEVDVHPKHAMVADLEWDDNAKAVDIEVSVASASKQPAAGALVIWRKARVRFTRADKRRTEPVPLVSVLSPESKQALTLTERDDFAIAGETKVPLRIQIPAGMIAGRLFVEVELDTQRGADAIVRCRISDGEAVGETAAEVGDTSTLLADPESPAVAQWKIGVAEFARALPEVSHREPAPSDRDPIPPLFDNTYNMPERNHFHTAIKYHRDDKFLVEHVLDDATRHELDQAWTDLLTSFEYHDANLRFAAKKFGVDKPGDIARFPVEARDSIKRLQQEHRQMQQALLAAEPKHVEDAVKFAQRAWRRPLSREEQQRLRDFYATLRREQGLDHPQATRALLARILVAPAFLYRAESAGGETASEVRQLSDCELASRLSYFLWSSLPDEDLLRAAAAGELSKPEELAWQTRRMLRDPKARRLATEFFGQWLGFYRFDEYRGIDEKRFPEFDESLKGAMYGEAVSFFTHIIRENRPVAETLFADYTFVNGPLARHYGLESQAPEREHVRVLVEDRSSQHRGGLLGMAALLTGTSAPLRTSAVKRGDWVLRRVLGTPVPPPPADAGSIAADDAGTDGLTVRQRLEAHRTDRSCVNCHARIDPLGFALEHYDPLGRWRDRYRDGQPIDSSGVLSDGTKIDGLDGLRRYLASQQPQFERNLCGKLLGYALGRAELASDRPLLEQMLAERNPELHFVDLVVHIATSKQFRYRRE